LEEQTIGQPDNSIPFEEHRKILRNKLESYRDKLLRLEQSNRSILLRRIYAKWSFDLSKLSIRGTPPTDLVIERAFQKRNGICLIPDSDNSELADKDRVKLRSLYRTLGQLELETGLEEAYLGFPFLVGHVGLDTYVRGPLILFPISIEYRKFGRPSGWFLSFSKEKPIIVNRALMALLKKKGRISLSGYSISQCFNVLRKMWYGYHKARRDEKNYERMVKYAKAIQDVQKDMGIKTTSFPHLGLYGDVFILNDKNGNRAVFEDHSAQKKKQEEYEKWQAENAKNIQKNLQRPDKEKGEVIETFADDVFPYEMEDNVQTVPQLLEPDEEKGEEILTIPNDIPFQKKLRKPNKKKGESILTVADDVSPYETIEAEIEDMVPELLKPKKEEETFVITDDKPFQS
jgi:hypothetical protein